ncbi:MAG: hypothetical protein COA73_14330 [Candidatus Hydrogenedentota bacterium]|nr:MAG: hypothetical protein COA73_14330 [Candidatus Hydrogenedentota bacterium]
MTAALPYPYKKKILIVLFVSLLLFLGFSKALLQFGDSFIREMAAQSALVRGDEMLNQRNYSSAVQEFRSFAMLAPDDYRAVSRLSESLILRGEIKEARVQAARALSLADEGEEVDALSRLARAEMGTEAAVATVDRAWEISSESQRETLALVRAAAYRRATDYSAATKMYRDYLVDRPESGEAWYGLAISSEGVQDFADLREQWANAAQWVDGEYTADYGNIVNRNRERAAYFMAQEKASELSAEDYASWGVALKGNGLWDQAQERFEQARDAGRVTPVTLYWLGVNAEIQGDVDKAKALYTGALDIDPSHEESKRAIERLGE